MKYWNGFVGELWKNEINVRDFIQCNYTPYTGDDSFLEDATENTKKVWNKLTEMFKVEREKGIYDAETKIPQAIDAYGPGYIDKDAEVIVGLQTDAPLKRGIFPKGGLRMVKNSLEAFGYEIDPLTEEIFTKYRKTHNEGVFSAYTDEMKACRKSGIITGLPDAYGRGRIIGDYRRVPLYGVDRLIEDKQQQMKVLEVAEMDDETIRRREEIFEQIKALKSFVKMGQAYGFDLSRPAENAKEAVQYLYFGYLAAVKDQDGAAMSLGRTSTFLDIYIQRDLENGVITEKEAQELIDQFIIKLRIVRFLRTPEYDALFSGDPTWTTESLGGQGVDGRTLVTKTSFRYLHTLYNLGPAPEPNMTVLWSVSSPENWKNFCAKVSIDTSAVQYENDDLMRPEFGDDYGIACCVSPMKIGKGMQFFGARANLPKTLLYALNGGRDEKSGVQVAPKFAPVTGDYLEYEDVMEKFEQMMKWLAGVYVNALKIIHYMHDKYAYEAFEMAQKFGSDLVGVTGTDEKLDVISVASKEACENFKQMAISCDEYIAKMVNGQTGTSDVKAWAGSAEVHERVLTEFTKSRMKRIQNDINYKLIPFLTAHGYPLNDCEFGFYTLMNKSDNTVDNKSYNADKPSKFNKDNPEDNLLGFFA